MAYIRGCGLGRSVSIFDRHQRSGNSHNRASRIGRPSYHRRHSESTSASHALLSICEHPFNSLLGVTWGMESWFDTHIAVFIFPRDYPVKQDWPLETA